MSVIRGRDSSNSDHVLEDNIMTGLQEATTLSTLMIVGALLNPLFQNGARMVAAGLCTQAQLEDGMKHLHSYVKEYYKRQEVDSVKVAPAGKPVLINKYDVPTNPDRTLRDSPSMKATKEINAFVANNNLRYLPKMEGKRTLGVLDERGQPKEPEYELGPVIGRG